MRQIDQITVIDESKLTEKKKEKIYLTKKILKDTSVRMKIKYPEFGYALSQFEYIPVKEKIGISTDGINILYNPDYVLCSGISGSTCRNTSSLKPGAAPIHSPEESILHIILHGMLGHFEIRNSYNTKQKLFFALMDYQTHYYLQQIYRDHPKEKYEPTVDIYPELAPLQNCYSFPHAFYMQCISNRYLESLVIKLMELKSYDNHYLWYLNDKKKKRELQSEFWKSARLYALGNSNSQEEAFHKLITCHGIDPGEYELSVTASGGTSLSYKDLLQRFFQINEGGNEDPESLDIALYQYGLELYQDVPLIEPADETLNVSLGTLIIAIDTSGSCSDRTASVFLRETRKILSDIETAGHFREIHILECDTRITHTYRLTDSSELTKIKTTMTLHGYGGTDFCPVFEYAKELEQSGKKVDAILYLTDSYGYFPEEEYANTYFIMEKDEFNENGKPKNKEIPDWITPVILE